MTMRTATTIAVTLEMTVIIVMARLIRMIMTIVETGSIRIATTITMTRILITYTNAIHAARSHIGTLARFHMPRIYLQMM